MAIVDQINRLSGVQCGGSIEDALSHLKKINGGGSGEGGDGSLMVPELVIRESSGQYTTEWVVDDNSIDVTSFVDAYLEGRIATVKVTQPINGGKTISSYTSKIDIYGVTPDGTDADATATQSITVVIDLRGHEFDFDTIVGTIRTGEGTWLTTKDEEVLPNLLTPHISVHIDPNSENLSDYYVESEYSMSDLVDLFEDGKIAAIHISFHGADSSYRTTTTNWINHSAAIEAKDELVIRYSETDDDAVQISVTDEFVIADLNNERWISGQYTFSDYLGLVDGNYRWQQAAEDVPAEPT